MTSCRTELYYQYRTSLNFWGFVCIIHTFSFQNKFYEQIEGVAMGSPVNPIVANLYMKHFEREAICSASNPPGIGLGLWITPLSC